MSVRTFLLSSVAVVLAAVLGTSVAGAAPRASSATCLKWKVTPTPTAGDGWNFLRAVAARSSKDAWAVGFFESDYSDRYTFALHWDGTAWAIVPTPNAPPNREFRNDNNLLDVAVVGRTDAWAVGYYHDNDGLFSPLAMHWNGTSWSLASLPQRPKGDLAQYTLYSVEGSAPDDIWAVGWFRGRPLGLHWDGSSWRITPMPRLRTGSVLYDVDVRARDDVWAVGRGTGRPLVLHWNGRRWRRIGVSRFRHIGGEFHGVVAVGPRSVWAVGRRFDLRTGGHDEVTLAARWNGRSWFVARTPNRGHSLNNYMDDVAAASGRQVWAVGLISDLSEEYIVPAIFRWNGRRWQRVAAGVRAGALWSVDLLSARDGWAAGWGPSTTRPLTERLTRC